MWALGAVVEPAITEETSAKLFWRYILLPSARDWLSVFLVLYTLKLKWCLGSENKSLCLLTICLIALKKLVFSGTTNLALISEYLISSFSSGPSLSKCLGITPESTFTDTSFVDASSIDFWASVLTKVSVLSIMLTRLKRVSPCKTSLGNGSISIPVSKESK